jgi:hypothetical protein
MIQQLRKVIFWDVNFEKLDVIKNKKLIVDRVLNLGNLNEFRFIMDTYGVDAIREEVKHIGYFDPKTLSFVSSFFQIKKESLACYTKKQSSQAHWN